MDLWGKHKGAVRDLLGRILICIACKTWQLWRERQEFDLMNVHVLLANRQELLEK